MPVPRPLPQVPLHAAAAVTEAGAKVASAAAGVAAVALIEVMTAVTMEVTMEVVATAFQRAVSHAARCNLGAA